MSLLTHFGLLIPAGLLANSVYVLLPILLSLSLLLYRFRNTPKSPALIALTASVVLFPLYETSLAPQLGWWQVVIWLSLCPLVAKYTKVKLNTTMEPDKDFYDGFIIECVFWHLTYFLIAWFFLPMNGTFDIIHNFAGYWLGLPFAISYLRIQQYLRYPERIALLEQNQAAMEAERQLMETIETDLPLFIKEIKQLSQETYGVVKNADIPNKWMTLEEQFAYLKTIPQQITDAYEYTYAQAIEEDDEVFLWDNHQAFITHPTMEWKDFGRWRYKYNQTMKPLRGYLKRAVTNQEAQSLCDNIERGIRGEEELEKELKQLPDNWKYLTNVRVEVDDVSSESDALIFSPYGMFTIEAKNFGETGSYSIHVSKDGKWTKKSNGSSYPMKDVVAQSNRHVLAKEKLLNRTLKDTTDAKVDDYIEIHGIITITNNVVDIVNDSPFPIMRLSHLHSHIRQFEKIYTQDDIQTIYDIFKQNMLPPQRFPIKDFMKEWELYRETYAPVVALGRKMYALDKETKAHEQSKGTLTKSVNITALNKTG